jgi:Ca-activated chloride channel homolog
MNRKALLVLSLLMLAWLALPAAAQGVIVPGIDTDPRWLTLDRHTVDVRISDQIAETSIVLQFTNAGDRLAEGTYLFPLPAGAAVDELVMVIDGQRIDAKILRAEEARAIYDEIVRQYRDPALLEYAGRDLLQASVFPIPPGESRRIEIRYGQLLTAENGLVRYTYPMHTDPDAPREAQQMAIRVEAEASSPITNVYSPTHPMMFSRPDDNSFLAGFERSFYAPESDFTLYYAPSEDAIGVNLISYRESAGEDGFFLLLVQPPSALDAAAIQPKDVVLVIDQSGSMYGEKWEQAQAAALYVLDHLNPQDRFNVVAFSTGWRTYADRLLGADEAGRASDWLRGLDADGGTDINGALLTALGYTDTERPLTVLFLTDGLATEGVMETGQILENLRDAAPSGARIFTFGVGDDVDTFLLDSITRDFRGSSTYVRPNERIDEEVAALYNQISAPVMTDVALEIDGAVVDWLYPQNLPDLFAGEQLTLVGRYRESGAATIALSGMVDGERVRVEYPGQELRAFAGGEPFVARLWATRRIGDLLNSIRLNGENEELIDSVVNLSIRYGIITPYTSFLITEDDILSGEGRQRALDGFREEAEVLSQDFTGASAVDAADTFGGLANASAPITPAGTASPRGAGEPAVPNETRPEVNPVQTVGGKTFVLQGEEWTDTTYTPDRMTPVEIAFLSDAYFDLLARFPEAGAYLALGERVLVVLDGTAYRIAPEG